MSILTDKLLKNLQTWQNVQIRRKTSFRRRTKMIILQLGLYFLRELTDFQPNKFRRESIQSNSLRGGTLILFSKDKIKIRTRFMLAALHQKAKLQLTHMTRCSLPTIQHELGWYSFKVNKRSGVYLDFKIKMNKIHLDKRILLLISEKKVKPH